MALVFIGLHIASFADAAEGDAAEQKLAVQAPVVRDIGSRRELFFDRFLIEKLEGAELKLHEPASGGVAIKLDKPWEGPPNGPIAIFEHASKLLMYYRAMTLAKDDLSGALCVATSVDGITWTKPALGLVERGGTRDTNVAGDDKGVVFMGVPWLDTRPGVPEGERIKAHYSEAISGEKHTAFSDPKGPKRLVVYGSADGFTFRKLYPQPDITSKLTNCFDGGNTAFWSEAEQCYVLYYRFMDGMRTIARKTSPDFLHWSEPTPMTYGGAPREQLYINNTQPYFRVPHIYVAPAARFIERRRVVTDEQVKAIGLKTSQGQFYGNDCSDAVLLTSRAGSTQYDRTFMEAFVRPGLGASNWVSRTNYLLTRIIPSGPNHIALFVARNYMQDSWHIERLLLRLDGFASVTAPWAGGEMLTRPLTFAGRELEINYRTSAAGSLRVEIQSEDGKPISGYAAADCQEVIGDETARIVRWKTGGDLSKLAGQPVRLRFVMKDADLFAIQFRDLPAQ